MNQNWNYVWTHCKPLKIYSKLIVLVCRFLTLKLWKKEIYNIIFFLIMKSFKSTASKIENPRFFFNKSPDVIYNEHPPPPMRPTTKGACICRTRAPRPPLCNPAQRGPLLFFFGTMGSFLIIPFVLVKDRSNNAPQPTLDN